MRCPPAELRIRKYLTLAMAKYYVKRAKSIKGSFFHEQTLLLLHHYAEFSCLLYRILAGVVFVHSKLTMSLKDEYVTKKKKRFHTNVLRL